MSDQPANGQGPGGQGASGTSPRDRPSGRPSDPPMDPPPGNPTPTHSVSSPSHPSASPRPSGRLGVAAWCLYDWANSAFPTVVISFIFAAYYTKAVAVDVATGTAQWGYALSLSALVVAVLSPLLGAIADFGGRRKPWLAAFTGLAAIAACALWTIKPEADFALRALVLVAIANAAFEIGMVFYNAMLPGLAPAKRMGRVSGWGWGLGYAGGLTCLVVALVVFVQPETANFGLDKATAEPIRATAILVGVWMVVFACPLFLFTPDQPKTGVSAGAAVKQGVNALIDTIRRVRDYAGVARFLMARMIYTDGLNTLFAFGGVYAAGTFGMTFEDLIVFGIGMNVTAGLGAAAFAWIDDWIGPKRTIQIALIALTVLGTGVLLVQSVTWFWVLGLGLGAFVGPAQAASRSMMAHMAPSNLRTEMFGLYALSGKATAFLGPALLGWITVETGSQRFGMATVVVFFGVGFVLLRGVPDVRGGGE